MSERQSPSRVAVNRLRATVSNFGIVREQRMFGPAEVIAVAGSLFILLMVIVSYVYFLVPANSRLDGLQSERARLQNQLRTSKDFVEQGSNTEAAVQKITQSLDDFEGQHLLGADRGRMGVYESLNAQIKKNGLRNTSGPTYTPLEATGSKQSSGGAHAANTKWQSVYPGLAISVTVEGQYQNLRRFVRDVEMNRQFVIINSVELERSTETNNALPLEGETPNTPRSALVSLRLEMATYFQRAATQPNGSN
jgi:Tfp pilus assembly protein PilO